MTDAPGDSGQLDGEPRFVITTERQAYAPAELASGRITLELIATLHNRLPYPVYAAGCTGTGSVLRAIERQVDRGWEIAYTPICQLVSSPPIVINPGDMLRDTHRVEDVIWRSPTAASMVRPAEFRARYSLFRARGGPPDIRDPDWLDKTEPLSVGSTVSTPFTIATAK